MYTPYRNQLIHFQSQVIYWFDLQIRSLFFHMSGTMILDNLNCSQINSFLDTFKFCQLCYNPF